MTRYDVFLVTVLVDENVTKRKMVLIILNNYLCIILILILNIEHFGYQNYFCLHTQQTPNPAAQVPWLVPPRVEHSDDVTQVLGKR